MKRDMDLIRKILFLLEADPHAFYNRSLIIDGYSEEKIGYHVALMEEAGLLEAMDMTDSGSLSPEATPSRLTWAGHDFLDACRDEGRWTKAKEIFGKIGEGVTFDVAKQILVNLMMASVTHIMTGGPPLG